MTDFASQIATQEWWSSFGFWVLVVGLVGEIVVIARPALFGTFEKAATIAFTAIVIAGCAFEHLADLRAADLVAQQQKQVVLRFADRKIPAEWLGDLGLKLRQFSPQNYCMFAFMGSREPKSLAEQIVGILADASWTRIAVKGANMNVQAGVSGLYVSANRNSPSQVQAAADGLVKLFRPFIPDVERKVADDTIPNDGIMITVGAKQ